MLNINDLLSVSTIITHEGCPDGISAALILRDALPSASIKWVQYNTKAHRELVPQPGMLFCDMTPHPDLVDDFVRAGAIVLDHHKGAREIVDAFGDRGAFADEGAEPGVSGAVLAYREVWKPICDHIGEYMDYADRRLTLALEGDVKELAELAGIRDTWRRNHIRWNDACAQAAALRFWPIDLLLSGGFYRLRENLEIGKVLLAKDEERDSRSIAEAHRFTVRDLRVVAFDGLHTSDIAERLTDEADLVLGWHYESDPKFGPQITVSCRSRGGFSALPFARYYGGGGHEHAAGFKIRAKIDASPYLLLRTLVADYLDYLDISSKTMDTQQR